jgi:putative peptidoglycan lipid II flippase
MFQRVINSKAKSITFAAIILFFSGISSRILALVRDRLLAGNFGAGSELDVYFAAFRIPDFVYGIFILGGVSTVFLPLFSEYFNKDSKKGWEFTNNVLNCFLVLLILTCLVFAVFAPVLIKIILPGFDLEEREMAVTLTRIMFLSPILLGVSSIFSGVLHYFNRFLVYSLAPIFYNLGIILGIVFLFPLFGMKGLAFGVIVGAFFHLIVQFPAALASGYSYKSLFNFNYPGLKKMFKLMIPRTIGSTAYHMNLIVVTAIASTLATGSIAVFNFSYNLNYIPIGLIGIPFALAVFPSLSRSFARKEKNKFISDFSFTLRQIMFLIIPASVMMFVLRAQIVRLILGTGRFSWNDTRLTAASLGIFCFGIFAAALIPFLSRTFYSFHNTKTPVKISIFSIIFNIFLCFFFIWLFDVSETFQRFWVSFLKLEGVEGIKIIALPLSLSIFSVLHSSLLLIGVKKRLGKINGREIFLSFLKIVIGTSFLVFSAYIALNLSAYFLGTQTFFAVLIQAVSAFLAGGVSFVIVSCLLGCEEIKSIKDSALKQFNKDIS